MSSLPRSPAVRRFLSTLHSDSERHQAGIVVERLASLEVEFERTLTMNKLRKPPSTLHKSSLLQKFATFPSSVATSMTMQYAAIPTTTPAVVSAHASSSSSSRSVVPFRESEQQNVDQQHWVTRALRAEALLAAHVAHREEVKTLGHHQEATRQRELTLVAREYKEKHEALERLLIFLLILIAILVILVAYLATYYVRHSIPLQQKNLPAWWSAVAPSHFTIPILSPFTSVVEHESSVIGAKSITTLAAISACLVYMIFRYWISSRGTTKLITNSTTSISSSSANNAARAIMSTASNVIDR